MEFEISPGS